LIGPIGEALVFPDRDGRLQFVDQCMARMEGLRTMLAGHTNNHRQVTNREITYSMNRRDRDHLGILNYDTFGDPTQLSFGRRVGRVGQPAHAAAGVLVPYCTDEHYLAPALGLAMAFRTSSTDSAERLIPISLIAST
jgi:hypothetical protein